MNTMFIFFNEELLVQQTDLELSDRLAGYAVEKVLQIQVHSPNIVENFGKNPNVQIIPVEKEVFPLFSLELKGICDTSFQKEDGKVIVTPILLPIGKETVENLYKEML